MRARASLGMLESSVYSEVQKRLAYGLIVHVILAALDKVLLPVFTRPTLDPFSVLTKSNQTPRRSIHGKPDQADPS